MQRATAASTSSVVEVKSRSVTYPTTNRDRARRFNSFEASDEVILVLDSSANTIYLLLDASSSMIMERTTEGGGLKMDLFGLVNLFGRRWPWAKVLKTEPATIECQSLPDEGHSEDVEEDWLGLSECEMYDLDDITDYH